MLMVVFGAGASYDSDPSRPVPQKQDFRPPLANELFENRPLFGDAIRRLPRCQPIIPYLRAPGVSVEQELERLQAEGEGYPEGKRQLAAIRFYLQNTLWGCGQNWLAQTNGVTNYKTLLDQIERQRRDGRVCIVTFNYDTLLEYALPAVGLRIESLPDYITNENYKVIKLHGSVDWGREVNTNIHLSGDPWEIANELIERAPDLDITQRYRISRAALIAKSDTSALFPAVAIPVETKRNYECPAEHVETLQSCLAQVTKVLVIGWRAAEAHFLALVKEHVPKTARWLVVAANLKAAEETIDRLQQAGIEGGEFRASPNGFTDFVVAREADGFLRS